MKMRVLGVDPAAAGPTGYGVVETDGRDCRALLFGTLRRSPRARRSDFPGRLREIHSLMARLVREFSPDAVAIEAVFTALNIKTALKLAEVRGVVQLAAAQGNVPVHSYSPREVKSTVAGYGQASKHQMQQMVRAWLGLRRPPEPADAADALAVALCHIHASQARARWAVATASRARPESPGGRAKRAGGGPDSSGRGKHIRLRASRIQTKR